MRIREPSKKLSLYLQPTPALTASHLGEDTELLVDKYRPLTCKSIIGQQGDRSNMNKLRIWLTDWNKNHLHKVCIVAVSNLFSTGVFEGVFTSASSIFAIVDEE
jgi:hypothetical protein